MAATLRAAGCVFAEDEAAELLSAAGGREEGWLAQAVERRVAGEPLEYVVGHVRFEGLRLQVTPGVFVPRGRTGLLAEVSAEALPRDGTLVDLCCGVGAVAAVVARRRPDATVVAADIDTAALECARANLAEYEPRASAVLGDLYAPLPPGLRGRIDVIAANAPYVPTAAIATMPREARESEARRALDGGADGMDVQRRVLAGAGHWLGAGGRLLIETAASAAGPLARAYESAGFEARVRSDERRCATLVEGRRVD